VKHPAGKAGESDKKKFLDPLVDAALESEICFDWLQVYTSIGYRKLGTGSEERKIRNAIGLRAVHSRGESYLLKYYVMFLLFISLASIETRSGKGRSERKEKRIR